MNVASMLLGLLHISFALFSSALALEFTTSAPTSCGDLQVDWTGGTPPFGLLLSPTYGTPANMTIPSSAFSDGKGSYSFQLKLNDTTPFLLTMFDQSGFLKGVNSDLLTTGKSTGDTCDLKEISVDFTFDTPRSLAQCGPFVFNHYAEGVSPLTIYGLIPLGDIFVVHIPAGASTYTWNANVASGTRIIFDMIDSKGRTGGATDALAVSSSDNRSCLGPNPPSTTTSAAPSQSASDTAPPPSESSSDAPTSKGTSMAAIAGTVVGSLLFLAIVITMGLFFMRRKSEQKRNPFDRRSRHSQVLRSEVDLNRDHGNDPFTANSRLGFFPDTPNPRTPGDYSLPTGHEPNPFVLSPLPPTGHHHSQASVDPLGYPTDENPFADAQSQSSSGHMSAGQRKRAMAGSISYKPTRFILHTDLDDMEPKPDEDGVIELPPQYTERRTNQAPPQAQPPQPGSEPSSPHNYPYSDSQSRQNRF